MTAIELSLAELAEASGLHPRTIRSWVAQGLLAGPVSRGPGARYPADTLERLLAIRAMRERLGMPLSAVRQELLVATAEALREHAATAADLAPEPSPAPQPDPSSALEYLSNLRARTGGHLRRALAAAPPASGFEALERRLEEGRPDPARKARAEEWLRVPVTPDVELTVRGPLDPAQRARIERCADLIRDTLLGRTA
ncbi:MerR family transcriptional regulator [Roseomonas sp. SSH11]|uniref:MerR family transcriptional regulator n=1 Tax=Pararoseomonas baculiformis TaxID=2820812 RepID=A0ABS4AK98_9PROT|nr:MerR family transcriptional regulator [Pararoseomonas baculiformis]